MSCYLLKRKRSLRARSARNDENVKRLETSVPKVFVCQQSSYVDENVIKGQNPRWVDVEDAAILTFLSEDFRAGQQLLLSSSDDDKEYKYVREQESFHGRHMASVYLH